MNNTQIINHLILFRNCDKFEAYHSLAPDISDTDENILEDFNELCDECAEELVTAFKSGNNTDEIVRKIIYSYYQKLSNEIADTEDWDFAQEMAIILGQITGVEMTPLFQKNMDDKKENLVEVHSLLNDANLTPKQQIGMNYLINKMK